MNIFDFFRKLKIPNCTCDICNREVFGGERICKTCLSALPWNDGAICPLCGRMVAEEGICAECKAKPLAVDRARSVFSHEGEAARLVVRFKGGEKYLKEALFKLLSPFLCEHFSETDALAFVPMTEKAQKARTFNQSRLLAEALAESCGRELLECLEKVRDTDAQKTLGRREREENLKGCFRVTDKTSVKGKNILIIDDTLTTGATSSELATVIKRAGAKEVCLLTVTSVPYQKS